PYRLKSVAYASEYGVEAPFCNRFGIKRVVYEILALSGKRLVKTRRVSRVLPENLIRCHVDLPEPFLGRAPKRLDPDRHPIPQTVLNGIVRIPLDTGSVTDL